jgi:hypothetical protein
LPDPTDQLPGEGTFSGVTVWEALSLFIQVTVLFTPMTIVIAWGEKPGAATLLTPDPRGIDTMTVDWALAKGSSVKDPVSTRRIAAPVSKDDLNQHLLWDLN